MASIKVPGDVDIEKLKFIAFDIKYNEPLRKIADKCLIDIKKESHDKGWEDYLRGWEISEHKEADEKKSYTLHNSTDYRLTHLLENGHLIVNKKGGVGWASPHPHIRPAFNRAEKNIVNVVKKEATIDIAEKG